MHVHCGCAVKEAQREEELADTTLYVNSVVKSLPMSDIKLNVIKQEQALNPRCQLKEGYTRKGWPPKQQLSSERRYKCGVPKRLLLYNGRVYAVVKL